GAALVGQLHDLFVFDLDGIGQRVRFFPPTLTLPLEGGGMGGGGGTSLAGDGRDDAGGQVYFADAVVLGIGDVERAAGDGHALRLVEAGFQRRAAVARAARLAGAGDGGDGAGGDADHGWLGFAERLADEAAHLFGADNYLGRGPITRCICGSTGYPGRPSRTHLGARRLDVVRPIALLEHPDDRPLDCR